METINEPVGRGCRNFYSDVLAVQRMLNEAGVDPGFIDGIFGSDTEQAIMLFQQRKALRQDGKVLPHGPTLNLLSQVRRPGIPSVPGAHIANSIRRFQFPIARAAVAAGIPTSQVTEFLEFWEKNYLSKVESVLGAMDSADQAILYAKFFFFLRKFGFSIAEASRVLVVVCGLRFPASLTVIEKILSSGEKFQKFLNVSEGVRNGLGYFILFIKVYNFLDKDEYSQAAANIYEFSMGNAVKWAALINFIQSLLPAPTVKSNAFFKVLRACDPIGLGGVAVDSFVLMVQAIIDAAMSRPFNEQRLADLVNRMKSGPTSLFAELGEKSGDALYEMTQMDAPDWYLITKYTWSELRDFFRGGSK